MKQQVLQGPIHLIGSSGIGMKGLTKLLSDLNYSLSGSDINLNTHQDDVIPAHKCYRLHLASNLGKEVKTIIYSAAIPKDNAELIEARKRGLTCLSRPEALAHIASQSQTCIAVSGTHGKTSTTALITHLLCASGYKPSYYIGGVPNNNFAQAHFNTGPYFITETDESDGSFLSIPASIKTLINIDNDHLSYYKNFETLLDAFKTYIDQTHNTSQQLVANIDNPWIQSLLSKSSTTPLSVGLDKKANLYADAIEFTKQGLKMTLYFQGKKQGVLSSALYGTHNIENSLVGIAAALCAGLSFSEILNALPSFLGTQKRFEWLSKTPHLILDYAHHPTAIDATLKAYQTHFKTAANLIFQPHRYSRLHHYFDEFVDTLSKAKSIQVLPIYSAQETETYGMSSQKLVNALQQKNIKASLIDSLPTAPNNQIQEPLMFMGAGDIEQLARAYAKQASNNSRKKTVVAAHQNQT